MDVAAFGQGEQRRTAPTVADAATPAPVREGYPIATMIEDARRYLATHLYDSEERLTLRACVDALEKRQHVTPDEAKWPAPQLIESEVDADCGCPEETWEAFGAHLFMHLRAGGQSDAHADFGDEGEVEMTVTASTHNLARAAIFGWARALSAGDRSAT